MKFERIKAPNGIIVVKEAPTFEELLNVPFDVVFIKTESGDYKVLKDMTKKFMMWLFVACVCLWGGIAQAMPVDVEYTGAKAELIDDGHYYGGGDGGYLGGPLSNSSLGGAWQFNLLSPTCFDYLVFDARVVNSSSLNQESLPFNWKLYTATAPGQYGVVPDQNLVAVDSSTLVSTQQNEYGFYDTTYVTGAQVPFKASLESGTYWLARERGFGQSGPIVDEIHPYIYGHDMARVEVASIHNPEPTTLALMGGGLFAMWRRRNGRA